MTKEQMYAAAALSKRYELLNILRDHVGKLESLTFNGTTRLSVNDSEGDILNLLSKHMSMALDEYELTLNNELSDIDKINDFRIMPF